MNDTEYARRVAALEAEGLTTSDAQGVVDADIMNTTKGTNDMTASTAMTTAQIRAAIRGHQADIDATERKHKATGTRRRNAEARRDYYPVDDVEKAKLNDRIARYEAKEHANVEFITLEQSRIRALNVALAASEERDRAAYRAKQDEQRQAVAEFVARTVAGDILATVMEHDLVVEPTGDGVSVGWDEPYEGRDGGKYVSSRRVSVELPHTWRGDREPGPAKVRWSSFGGDVDPIRYGTAIMVAGMIAEAITAAGLTDESWNIL